MYFIKQIDNHDCGFASLKMLLANIYKDKRYLYLKQDLNKKRYSYLELINIAKKYNLSLTGLKFIKENELKKYRNKIFLATIKIGETNHLVMIKKERHLLKVYDPNQGIYYLSYKKFFKVWDKTILSILNYKENTLKNNDLLTVYKLRPLYGASNIIFRLISIISIILGLFFVSYKTYFYVAIALFFISLLGEVFYRLSSIKSLKKIDIDFANKFKIKDGYYDVFYNNFLNYKKMYVTKNANVVFSILLAIFILTLFIINGVSNIYFLIFAIILAFINVGIIKPMFYNASNKLALKEQKYLNEKYDLNTLKTISNDSYKIANNFLFFEAMFIVLIILMCSISSFLISGFDISYVVFYSVTIAFFKKQFEEILSFNKKEKEFKKQQVLIANMLDDA